MTQIDYGLDITRVTLAVNDLDAVTAYYKRVVGLHVLQKDAEHAVLGTATKPLLELQKDSHAQWQPNAPGLYHTAFLLPDRSDLAAWFDMASKYDVIADGASDHTMSEAVYLTDPEGNGIEIYADRPRDVWANADGSINGGSKPIDFADLMPRATHWTAIPDAATIGHVHLQVGDLAASHDVFVKDLGMDQMSRLPGMAFYAVGGYHHQFGANTNLSRGMDRPNGLATGLRQIDMAFADTVTRPSQIDTPWGTRLTIGTRDAIAA